MNTLDFFKAVLPSTGLKVLAELVPIPNKRDGWRYRTFSDIEQMSRAVAELDAQGKTIYHACNGFGDWYFDEKRQRRRLRTAVNVQACRSLYDDIDVGKEGCYATRKEAAAGIKAFITQTNLPAPMVVTSGGGLHLYWPMTEDITAAQWVEMAGKKRLLTQHFKLLVDSAVDVDPARVLRPVGSTWRKAGDRVVTAVSRGVVTPPSVLLHALDTALESLGLGSGVLGAVPDYLIAAPLTNNLLAGLGYPDSYADIVATHCNQIALFRDTGTGPEPLWRAWMGAVKHCVDGEAYCHEWSKKDARYDAAETQSKISNWVVGPPTCDTFRRLNPSACAGCTQQCKTPVQLGLKEETTPPVMEALVEPPVEGEAPAGLAPVESVLPEFWPEFFGYSRSQERIERRVTVEGVVQNVPVASPLFYPLGQIREDDGTWAFEMRMHTRKGVTTDFKIPAKAIADPRSLRTALAAQRVDVMNDKLTKEYLASYMAAQRKAAQEKHTHRQWGWNDDFTGFLVGDTLITEAGPVVVALSENSFKDAEDQKIYRPTGTAEAWSKGVSQLYNKPGLEPYQYVIATVFGSVLAPLLGFSEWKGIPLAVTSPNSGYGKSTVTRIAVNALYQSDLAMSGSITPKAVIGKASKHKHLLLYADEAIASDFKGQDLADTFYILSNGRGREGMSSDGTLRKGLPPFCLMSILTGNQHVVSQVTESRLNPEAAQMRVLELDLYDIYGDNLPFISGENSEIVAELTSDTHGVLTETYVKYIIKHREEVVEALRKRAHVLIKEFGATANKERFYAFHMACSIVGAQIAKKLGFIDFDITAMKTWMSAHIAKMRKVALHMSLTPKDRLSALLSDLHGTLLITKAFDGLDIRKGITEMPLVPIRNGTVSGRLALGTATERGKLYLSLRTIDDWCKRENLNAHQFKRELLATGLIRNVSGDWADKRIYLGRGVPTVPTGQSRCLEIEFSVAQGYVQDHCVSAEVVDLAVTSAKPSNPVGAAPSVGSKAL